MIKSICWKNPKTSRVRKPFLCLVWDSRYPNLVKNSPRAFVIFCVILCDWLSIMLIARDIISIKYNLYPCLSFIVDIDSQKGFDFAVSFETLGWNWLRLLYKWLWYIISSRYHVEKILSCSENSCIAVNPV